MPWRRPVGALEARQPPAAVEERHCEPGLKMHPIESPDGRKKADGRLVTPHEDVLAIVYQGAGGGIAKRTRAAAQMRLLFEQTHLFAGIGQRHTRRQAGKTATDDEDIIRHGWLSGTLSSARSDQWSVAERWTAQLRAQPLLHQARRELNRCHAL